MGFHPFNVQDFEKWTATLESEHSRPGWHIHDASIQSAVNDFYNFHFGRAGYIGPPWKLIKAQIWVEGGGPRYGDAWRMRPMQIGNPGDAGILDVCHHHDMPLIAPPQMRLNFNETAIRNDPYYNIQAGLALLHLKLAHIQNPNNMLLFLSAKVVPASMNGATSTLLTYSRQSGL